MNSRFLQFTFSKCAVEYLDWPPLSFKFALVKMVTTTWLWLLVGCGICSADTIQVTIDGGLKYYRSDGVDPWNSSVSTTSPTPFSLTFTYDSSTPNTGNSTYIADSFSLKFGSYSTGGSPFDLMVYNNVIGSFLVPFTSGKDIAYPLLTLELSGAPPITLSDLTTQPASDFITRLTLEPHGNFGSGPLDDSLSGTGTSYSVRDLTIPLSVPEPSAWALALLAGSGLFYLRWRLSRAR